MATILHYRIKGQRRQGRRPLIATLSPRREVRPKARGLIRLWRTPHRMPDVR